MNVAGPAPTLGPLHQVALPSADLARSVEFYRDRLGLRLVAEFDPPGLAFFALGDTRLLLERHEVAVPGSAVLYLRVADIEAAYAALRARKLAFESTPHLIHRDEAGTFGEPGGEEWMAFFRDPDGNHLALVSRR
jgi:methylmalonyl-CoA/ethylmalonyl-CoA epimerase